MNKAVISSIISGIVGFALGAVGTYLYFDRVHTNNTEREYLEYKKKLEEDEEIITNLQSQVAAKLVAVKKEMLESKPDYTPEEPELVNLTIDDISNDEVDENESPEITDEIHFISRIEYENEDDYEKDFIKYFSVDKVIVYNDDTISIDEFMNYCGSDIVLRSFGKYGSDNSSEVFVRNEHFCTDYKIKRYKISYERYLNGLK